jgi:hypothetical protein
MNYIDFYKYGNYPDDYKKASFMDYEQSMRSMNDNLERQNGKKPLPFKNTYNNLNNRIPHQIYTSQYKYKPVMNAYNSQMKQLNLEDEGQNIAFLDRYYGAKKLGEFFVEPDEIQKVSIAKTKNPLVMDF